MARVLVVDDEPSIAMLVAEVIEGYGHVVDVAYNGKDGLAMTEGEIYNLIISDIMMPYLSGQEFMEQVRAKPAYAQTVFILMSAVSQLVQLEGEATADAFIVKPFDLAVIDKIVNTFLPPGPGKRDNISASLNLMITPARYYTNYTDLG